MKESIKTTSLQDGMGSQLSLGRIIRTWWPLAASWLLMGVEMPAISAIMARLANPEINLAAYGGLVFPLALIIESPVIMLLAASTALSKDWDSFIKVRKFMMVTGAVMTLVHILIAFTPLYYLVADRLIGAPEQILEPGRIGLMILTPWTWSIGYRRFHQGVLIRFGRSRSVSAGTVVRLVADVLVLAIGFWLHTIPGIIVGASAVSIGVVCEAIFVGIVVRPIVHGELRQAPKAGQTVTLRSFLSFYVPLAMTSLLTLIVQPIGSAALSRMPMALQSLAVWPVVSGLSFMFRSLGVAYNEVVVALLDEPLSSPNLRRFTGWLGVLTSLGLFLLAVSPLAYFWFESLSALTPELSQLARIGLWFALPMPYMAFLQSWYQGAILHGRKTRAITEAVIIYLVSIALFLFAGTLWSGAPGLYVGLAAMSLSMGIQTVWLWVRSRGIILELEARDTVA